MANYFYNRGASFNPDELADGDAIEAEFDAVARGFDTIEDLMNVNKAGYPTQTFHVATATESTHAVPKAQMDTALGLKLDAVNYNASDILTKLKTVDGTGSGLDADLLDGQDGAYYRNATNINAGTLDKARLPASVDANTTGNAATATKTTATAPTGSSAELMRGAMGGNDYFLIRIGGNADAGWSEIATADNGTEPIYVRQYTGDFASVANEITLLDASGNTVIPGNLKATTGGVTVKDTNCGMYPGNGDSASSTINNLKLSSWFGIGFGPSISGLPVPLGEYSHWFNVRNGDMGVRGTITAPQLNGNASTATRLATTRQINGVNFDGTANITVEPYVEQDTGTNAARYLTFVDSSTAGYKRLNLDTGLTFNPSTNTLTCSVSGNASTASKLATARTITLTGDVTGSVAFDGSNNATITAALSDAGVLASCAAASAGGVGSYVLAKCLSGVYTLGKTIAGSSLNPVSYSLPASEWVASTTALSGTWRFMSGNTSGSNSWVGIWLRIS